MDIYQYAVYQLKNVPENRQLQFQSYASLTAQGILVNYKNYEQVYLRRMQPEDTPERIRERFNRHLPNNFKGHSISVSDVLVLNKRRNVTFHYVEKEGFVDLVGFIPGTSSGSVISMETTGFHLEGKKGTWLAFDSMVVDGKEFFLMEHEQYGRNAEWLVVDENGKLVADNVYHGFDQAVQKAIREYLHPPQPVPEPEKAEKPPLENWQKYMENGEYLRSSEMDEEQNYNMIDGRRNNMAPKKSSGRRSILAKLKRKQTEIALRSGKQGQQMEAAGDMERRQQ